MRHLHDREIVFVENFWLLSAGFPSVSRNRDAYQSIDHQDESTSPANPFNQAQDSKPARTYWERARRWTMQCFPLAFYAAVQCLGAILKSILHCSLCFVQLVCCKLQHWKQIEQYYDGKSQALLIFFFFFRVKCGVIKSIFMPYLLQKW